MTSAAKLCIALDDADRERILELADATERHVDIFKIGLTAFTAHGPALVRELGTRRPIFIDLKLHDIPAQVEGAVAAAASCGARFVTVHAAGGYEMVKAAVAAGGEQLEIVAVTVLTSLDEGALNEIGIAGHPADAVARLGELALRAGAAGLVCSPLEVAELRQRFGRRVDGGPLLVVPGIRRPDATADDQRRTWGPVDAVGAGGDVIVVGRPVTRSEDPAQAAAEFAADIHGGRK